jgi:hypothetical protein
LTRIHLNKSLKNGTEFHLSHIKDGAKLETLPTGNFFFNGLLLCFRRGCIMVFLKIFTRDVHIDETYSVVFDYSLFICGSAGFGAGRGGD